MREVGILQLGGGPQVIIAAYPEALVAASEVNTKVKLPETEVAVYDGGIVVPDNVANKGKVVFVPS